MMRLSSAAAALAAAAAVASALSPARAADLPRSAPPALYSAPPAFTWTGFYVGANIGAGWGKFTRAARGLDTDTGLVAGGTLGYNHQFGQFVAGLEGDYNYSGLEGRTLGAKGALTSFGTIRGRLGMAFDRALIYGTGGYAFGTGEVTVLGLKESKSHQGYAVGGGLEYAFTQNVSAKAEYLYIPLDKKTYFSGLGPLGFSTGLNVNIVRAGVNYRF